MTDLEQLKALLSINGTDEDTMLTTYLNLAKMKILQKLYPFGIPNGVEDIPSRYEARKIEIAMHLYLRRGSEGELTDTENGITRQYARGTVPPELLSDIPSFVEVLR